MAANFAKLQDLLTEKVELTWIKARSSIFDMFLIAERGVSHDKVSCCHGFDTRFRERCIRCRYADSPTAAPGARGRQGTDSDHRQVAGCRQGPVWEEPAAPAAAGRYEGLIGNRMATAIHEA